MPVASHAARPSDVSINEDSGWRKLDPYLVAKLVKDYKDGKYGVTLFTKPALLMHAIGDTVWVTASDSKRRLSNGKHHTAALYALEVRGLLRYLGVQDCTIGSSQTRFP